VIYLGPLDLDPTVTERGREGFSPAARVPTSSWQGWTPAMFLWVSGQRRGYDGLQRGVGNSGAWSSSRFASRSRRGMRLECGGAAVALGELHTRRSAAIRTNTGGQGDAIERYRDDRREERERGSLARSESTGGTYRWGEVRRAIPTAWGQDLERKEGENGEER
jgi:hypothetical protein